MIPNEKHQGFQAAQPSEAPRGSVLLVEPQHAHEKFLQDNPYANTVLLRVNHIQTLLKRGETADTYFGKDTTVITTTTINDKQLAELDWQEERDLVKAFQSDYHIPCDYPVYKAWSPEKRREHVLDCLKGTIWMASELRDVKTQILPLVKGETYEERKCCYKVFQEVLDTNYCIFYGTQYFTSGKGFKPLLSDIRQIVSEASDLKIMLIGLQATDYLEKLPPQVVAAAGQSKWIRETQLREISWKESQEKYGELHREIENSLETGQVPLGVWTQSEVTA